MLFFKFYFSASTLSFFCLAVQAPDGFHGTYEEVVAHEKKIGRKFCEETGKEIPLSTTL